MKFNKIMKNMQNIFQKMNEHVSVLNNSKLFAGLMIIILNIASKFVTIKLSKTMEAYLKYTFSKQILVFAMAWMGTRDIYVSLFITAVFTVCIEFFFNEESQFCLLPESFTNYHLDLMENKDEGNPGPSNISNDDLKKAKDILEKLGVTLAVNMNADANKTANNVTTHVQPNMSIQPGTF